MKEKIICLVTPHDRTYYRTTPIAKEFLDKDNSVINTSGTLPQGEVEEYNVSTKTIKHYVGGKLDGELSIIDLGTGKVTFSETYKGGVLTDITGHPHDEEEKKQEPAPLPHYDGTVIRTNKKRQAFYVDGKEVAERTLNTNGQTLELLGTIPDGPAKEFDENGKLRCETTFKNNEQHGETRRYDDQARLLSKENYQQGLLNGEAEYFLYNLSGTVKTTANYKNGVLYGPWTNYFPNGAVCTEAFYQNGKLQGTRRTKHANGKLDREENFENGKLQGKRTLYFPEGGLWYEENYKNGRLDGERISYFHSGAKRSQSNYSDGLLEGPRYVYAENGDLLLSENYHWGTLEHNTAPKPANQ